MERYANRSGNSPITYYQKEEDKVIVKPIHIVIEKQEKIMLKQ